MIIGPYMIHSKINVTLYHILYTFNHLAMYIYIHTVDEDRIHTLGTNGATQLLYGDNKPFHAAFVRDPISRSLSAFLDKCINAFWFDKYWCQPATLQNKHTRKPVGVYSQFDIFIENIINKPVLYNATDGRPYPEHFLIWVMDFHWLPQNFICDMYKFIDNYHIYHMHNESHRKQFIVDIGGDQLWKDIGSYGWLKRNAANETMIKLHFGPDKEVKIVHKGEYFGKLHREYRDNTLGIRKHPPKINKVDRISEVNVSFLESGSFHGSRAGDKLFKYYRSDLLAKAIAYYEDDYSLFGMNVPDIVCEYLKYDQLVGLMQQIAEADGNTKRRRNEEKFRKKALSIFHGFYSIYHPDADYRGDKDIPTKEYADWEGDFKKLNENESPEMIEFVWHRDEYTKEKNLDTKIPHFYDIMDFDERFDKYLFGVTLSGIRGMMSLINVLSFVDPKIWPNDLQCFNMREYDFDLGSVVNNEIRQYSNVIFTYFDEILPMLMERVKGDAHEMNYINKRMRGWFRTDVSNLNVSKLIMRWIEEDKVLYANIRAWVLYQRDVPRQMHNIAKDG